MPRRHNPSHEPVAARTPTGAARASFDNRAAIYARVSTGGQVDSTSIDGQLEQCRTEIKRHGWLVAGEFVDAGVSGAKNSRPALDEMLAAASAGLIEVVVIAKLDRLGRSLLHLLTLMQRLDQLGVRIVSASDHIDTRTPAGRMMVQLLGVFAEFERELIKERSRDGARRRAQDGGFVSSIPPFGYIAVPDPSGRRGVILQIDPIQAACIRAMYQHLAVERLPLSRVVRVLNEAGHLSPKGKPWTMGTLQRWARGSGHLTAAGAWQWSDLSVDIPAILTKEEAAEWSAWATDTLTPQSSHGGYLLSGFVITPCGRRYLGRTAGKQSPIYACGSHLSTRVEDPTHCDCRNISVDALDQAVWDEVRRVLMNPAARNVLERESARTNGVDIGVDTLAPRSTEAARAVSALQQRIADEYRAALEDGFDPPTARLMVRPLKDSLIAAKQELSRLTKARAAAARATTAKTPGQTTEAVPESLGALDTAGKRDVLAALGVEVTISSFEVCPACQGTGYGPDPNRGTHRPPAPCARCRRMRWLPVVHVAITAPDVLLAGLRDEGQRLAI